MATPSNRPRPRARLRRLPQFRALWTLAAFLPVLVLAACSDPAALEPREAAIEACEQMALAHYDLSTAGRTEIDEVPITGGDSFEVAGESEGTAWVCTWSSTSIEGGTTTETTIATHR